MKLSVGVAGLLIGFLAACSTIKQENATQPLPDTSQVQKEDNANGVNTYSSASANSNDEKLISGKLVNSNSLDSIGKAAKLSPTQIQQLKSLEKSNIVEAGEPKNRIEKGKIKAIIPMYIPPGFQIDKFNVNENGEPYSIVYKNSSNSCFHILAVQYGGDRPIQYNTTNKISSLALGEVVLGYTEFPESDSSPSIGFPLPVYKPVEGGDSVGYFFASPASNTASGAACNSISLQEGIKIVESLQYLNPENK